MKMLLILILLSSLFLSGCTKNKIDEKNHIAMTEDTCVQFGAKYDEEQGRKPGTWTVGNDGSCESKSTTHVKNTEQECVNFGEKRDKEEGRESMIWTSDVDGNCVGRSK
ncbi:hypothetical protein H8K32_11880 [Undibacterium jejuense]|uniref:Lipoprotein n=1 Tax=Undibacterium jejuense TaxID=1344949 RepID=A0A923HKZ3_9BURK|nr:hypothetical protein [Undibacterium jejuense]MBC3862804.1 hypothetical protein [Undibacterium jejuense]